MKTQIRTKKRVEEIQVGDYFCLNLSNEYAPIMQKITSSNKAIIRFVHIQSGKEGNFFPLETQSLIKLKIVAFENDTLIFEPVD